MKKTILAMVLLGTSAAVLAQDSLSVNTNTNTNSTTTNNQKSTGNYPAYGVAAPSAVQMSFNREHPTGATAGAQWQQTYNGYWRATYKENGRQMNVYYAENGQSFNVALPVLQSGVSEDIVNKAMDLYGNNIYDINIVKGHDKENHYLVRVIENGQLRAERMNADGAPFNTSTEFTVTTTEQTGTTPNTNAAQKSMYRSDYYAEPSPDSLSTDMNQNATQDSTSATGTTGGGNMESVMGIDDTPVEAPAEEQDTAEPNNELYNNFSRSDIEEELTEDDTIY